MKREQLQPARIAVEFRAAGPDDKRPANEVEMVAFSGAPIQTYDWQRGGPVELQFEMTDRACDLGRVRAGRAPLLLDHRSYSVAAVQGAVTDGWIEDGRLLLKARFSARADAQAILADVKDKILNSVSMGAFLHSMKEITKDGDKVRRFKVTKWEPYEVSVVSVGADPGAGFLAASAVDPPACEVVELNLEEQTMADTAMKTQAEIEAAAAEARKAEFARQKDLRGIADLAKVPAAMLTAWLDNPAMTPDQARAAALEHKAQAQDPEETPVRSVRMTADERDKYRASVELGLFARMNPSAVKDEDLKGDARGYRSMSLLRLAEECIVRAGGNIRNLTKDEVAFAALGYPTYAELAGMHSTSDFPNILSNLANKSLVAAYRLAGQTFRPFTSEGQLNDFKPATRLQVGGFPSLLAVGEHQEIQRGTTGESKETVALGTYARIVSFTRQLMINDDLDALNQTLQGIGAAVSRLESTLVYEQLTSNPTMGDTVALFHASHGNLGTAGVVSVTTIGEARKLMRLQKDLNAADFLSLVPVFIIAPPSLETTIDKEISSIIAPTQTSNANPFGPGGRTSLTSIIEPRLEASSTTAFYFAAAPEQGVRPMEILYLAGQRQPRVVRQEGFAVEGIDIKVVHDVAAKVGDWRAWVKNAGQ